MTQILLPYGQTTVPFEFVDERFAILTVDSSTEHPLSDIEVGSAFDAPIGSAPLDELINGDDSVLIVVSDATRATGSAQIVNLLVRRLIQSGVAAGNIAIIFATGIHRSVTEAEKVQLLTPFIVQRIRTIVHDAYDPSNLISLGQTDSGVKVEVNRALRDFSRIVLIGGIGYHYFAGFTGGRKSICPGLASAQTIEATHMLALDFALGGRKAGVGTGRLNGNAVHLECERVAQLVSPTFGINTIVDDKNRAVGAFCGDWRQAHRAACDYYLDSHSVEIESKRELVIASCGGFPHDINLIQSHKAMDMAAHACVDGGTIILLAQCSDGLGRPDFMKWFESADSRSLEARLRDGYEVNGQTAWSLLTKAEKFRVILVSDLPEENVRKMRMEPAATLDRALAQVNPNLTGYIMPRGAAILPRIYTEKTDKKNL
jgi:nickel-dependent lactate racemase